MTPTTKDIVIATEHILHYAIPITIFLIWRFSCL